MGTARTVAVTGSASGIGAAVRAACEAAGDTVVGVDLRDAAVLAALGTPAGGQAAVAAVGGRCGGRLDGLVCCAGVGPPNDPALILAVNHFGTVGVLDGVLGVLGRGREPAAVVIGSHAATITPMPDLSLCDLALAGDEDATREAVTAGDVPSFLAYGISKRALAVAVRRRASEWGAAGVRLNAVAPGPVETPLLQRTRADPLLGPLADALPSPLGRTGLPADIAGAVRFLLGPEAAFVHGAVLFVDGGTDAMVRPDAF